MMPSTLPNETAVSSARSPTDRVAGEEDGGDGGRFGGGAIVRGSGVGAIGAVPEPNDDLVGDVGLAAETRVEALRPAAGVVAEPVDHHRDVPGPGLPFDEAGTVDARVPEELPELETVGYSVTVSAASSVPAARRGPGSRRSRRRSDRRAGNG